jgi:hypothetical protein
MISKSTLLDIKVLSLFFSYYLQRKGVKGAESLAKGMDSPVFKYFFVKISLSDANDAPLQLNGTVGGATVISPFPSGTRARQ